MVNLGPWLAVLLGGIAATFFFYRHLARLGEARWWSLFHDPLKRRFDLPGSLVGLVFYTVMAFGLAAPWSDGLLFAMATLAALGSLYLISLLLRRHIRCPMCWMAHVANLSLCILLGLRLLQSAKSRY